MEEVEAGLEQDPEVIYTDYPDPKRDPWRTQVLPVLRAMPTRELAAAVGLSERRLRDVLSERARPHQATEAVLTRIIASNHREDDIAWRLLPKRMKT